MKYKINNLMRAAATSILLALSVAACFDSETETEMSVSEVPGNIVTIVQNTLPGISLTEAEKKVKNGTVIYELEGKLVNGNEYEINITESGTILNIELED